ncbi:MAG: hypothetical protein B7Y89_07655 [Novosphingobium sp. 32-60-15]|uniref:SMEK domain-containing protein n=1 Tax=unclassified Novosphingobium TaxID=2644732 RepID=UPI000BCE1AE3|nr:MULTISPECIES: SMEK domain-containing protein [unclassified Novosphingobium]OYX62754.1 MAG: hypothetical protein B7Y89_07655 [Novosphingobium sp. 32-60-15]
MNRAKLLGIVTYYLSHLRMSVEASNSLNLQDLNVHAEIFFRDLLNLALDYDLININIAEKNARAIDLGDEAIRIAIQVTSTADFTKVRHTFDGFIKANLQNKYDRLIVLIIGTKKNYREQALGAQSTFSMSISDDVWDVEDLLRKIGGLNLDKLQACQDFLRKELRLSEPRQSNEVRTLMRLIEVLSASEDGIHAGDNREDPDPEGKIRDRFANHADFLQQEYVKLFEIYGLALKEVEVHTDLGHVRVRKLQVYLWNWSDRVLREFKGDPEVALQALCDRIMGMMGTGEADFDEGAVRYYLINQLIACNVFPNKATISA